MEQRGKELANRALGIWPPLIVDEELVEVAEYRDMQAQAARRDVEKVPMSVTARNLFRQLREKVLSIDTGIIELAEQRSVTYHDREFFMEVLPRKDRLTLLLPLDFNEVDDPSGIARDA